MRQRCNNPNSTHYRRYGGRGISYESTWESFDAFIRDMGPKPSSQHTLERIDNDKNYGPENCKWASRREQARNRGGERATRLYTFNGVTLCIADWAQRCGIRPQSMQKRLNNDWPLERAFAEALNQ
jgi:hypothetical protein